MSLGLKKYDGLCDEYMDKVNTRLEIYEMAVDLSTS